MPAGVVRISCLLISSLAKCFCDLPKATDKTLRIGANSISVRDVELTTSMQICNLYMTVLD